MSETLMHRDARGGCSAVLAGGAAAEAAVQGAGCTVQGAGCTVQAAGSGRRAPGCTLGARGGFPGRDGTPASPPPGWGALQQRGKVVYGTRISLSVVYKLYKSVARHQAHAQHAGCGAATLKFCNKDAALLPTRGAPA